MAAGRFCGPLAGEFAAFAATLEASATAGKTTLTQLRALDRYTAQRGLPSGTIDENLAKAWLADGATRAPNTRRARLPASPRDRKWFGDGLVYRFGRASLCSLALIAAGSCERAAGSGGAKRPRSGAAGALDAAARERTMAGGGKGSEPGVGGFGGWRTAFLVWDGVTCSVAGRGRRGAARLT